MRIKILSAYGETPFLKYVFQPVFFQKYRPLCISECFVSSCITVAAQTSQDLNLAC